MSGDIPPLPQYAFMALCSLKAQVQLYLYLTTRIYNQLIDYQVKINRLEPKQQMFRSIQDSS
jgi:hypothetical protein